jgi:NitT/TauT family transport system substrate-binding protein
MPGARAAAVLCCPVIMGDERNRMKARRTRATALAATAAALALTAGCASSGAAAAAPRLEKTNLTVAVVPALDSAGFFIALYQGLFKAQGLTVHFVPAVSSETVIDQQAEGKLDITGGNYISYIQAQQNWDHGERPSPSDPGVLAANLDIFAQGSVMEQGAQEIYTMPDSPIRTLSQLQGRTVAINAPDNILYLLAASVLTEHGISPAKVHFVTKYALPQIPAELKAGAVDAAVLPEPFASIAEESEGAVPLADLNQGATTSFPVVGYVVTKQWAKQNPNTLAAFYRALEQGQQIADTDRGAVEKAMEDLPQPLGVSADTASIIELDSYPVSGGPPGTVDKVQLQRVVDVMQQFLGFGSFHISSMLMNGG